MKLWLFHHYALPPTESGITRHYQLAYELKKRGHDPVLIAADTNHRKISPSRLAPGMDSMLDTSNDVPILWLRTATSKASHIARVWNMISFAWRIFRRTGLAQLEKPDLIIGCTPDLFSAYMAKRLAKKLDVPFVFHVGELWPLMLTALGNVPKWHPFVVVLGLIEKHLYQSAGAILTPQPRGDAYIAERGGDTEKVYYIPNGVDLDVIPVTPPQPTGTRFKVMYIGGMGKANGVDEILDTARLMKDKNIEFCFMGSGPFKDRFMTEAKNDGLNNVTFPPPVSRKDVYRAMQDANAFIVNVPEKKPYSYGLAHNKIYDYMAVARPTILATHAPDDPITEYDAGILVPANDSEGMAKAIDRLMAMHPEDREKMGVRARKGVEEKYNFENLGGVFENALNKSLDTHRSNH